MLCEQCGKFYGTCCAFHFIACDADAQKDVYYRPNEA